MNDSLALIHVTSWHQPGHTVPVRMCQRHVDEYLKLNEPGDVQIFYDGICLVDKTEVDIHNFTIKGGNR